MSFNYLPREFKGVPVVWAAERPFGELSTRLAAEGSTIFEIVASTPRLPPAFATRGIVVIDGQEIPRQFWHHRPKCDERGAPVIVQLGIDLQGGGGGGGKSVLRTAAVVALLVAAVAVGQFEVLGTLGTLSIGAGSITGAQILAAGLATAALAVGAISPPPAFNAGNSQNIPTQAPQNAAALVGNVLAAGASIPQVIGSGMRVFPPLVAPVLLERIGLDQFAEACYALTGPHALWSPRLGSVGADQIDGVQIQLYDGKPDSIAPTLITRQAYTQQISADLIRHRVNADNQDQLFDQSNPDNSTPDFMPLASRSDPDEIWITGACEGLADWNSPGTAQGVPLRVQFRRRGAAIWTNGPEFHLISATGGAFEFTVKLIFKTPPLSRPKAPASNGVYLAYKNVPAQTTSPARGGWHADAYFGAIAGNDLYSSSTSESTNVRNVGLFEDRIELYLDPAIFPQDTYEIQLQEGLMYVAGSFTPSTYVYTSSLIYDFFGYKFASALTKLPRSRANLKDRIAIERVDSIWNSTPVAAGKGLALMQVRVKNQSLGQFSIMAAAMIPTFDGITWSGLNVSPWPADHFRNVLLSDLNRKRIPQALVGDKVLQAWRQFCIDRTYMINAVLQDRTALEVLDVIASAGFARRRHAEKFDVTIDYSRRNESPLCALTPRNTSDVSWQKPLGDLPDGYRVRFFDETDDFRENSIVVLRPGTIDTGRYDQVNDDAHTAAADVVQRATFDLRQLTARMTFYSCKTNFKHLTARRGSLVLFQHDSIERKAGWARIDLVIASNGILAGFILDQSIPTPAEDMWSNSAALWSGYGNMWAAARYGIAIERANGSVSVHEISLDAGGESNVVMLKTPIADPGRNVIDHGAIVASGPLSLVSRRCLIVDITPSEDFTAIVTLVDEAPELFNADGSIALAA